MMNLAHSLVPSFPRRRESSQKMPRVADKNIRLRRVLRDSQTSMLSQYVGNYLIAWIPTKLLNPLSAEANAELSAACAGMTRLCANEHKCLMAVMIGRSMRGQSI